MTGKSVKRNLIGGAPALALLMAACASEATPPSEPTQPPTAVPPTVEQPLEPEAVSEPTQAPPTEETDVSENPDTGTPDADVEFVRAVLNADGTWTFHVTVRHPDTGWEDYADGWDVVTPDGTVLKPDESSPFTRLLLHPHETEQPFTRSQGGVQVPQGVTQVTVRAHDIVDGFGGQEVIVDLAQEAGDGFEVER